MQVFVYSFVHKLKMGLPSGTNNGISTSINETWTRLVIEHSYKFVYSILC